MAGKSKNIRTRFEGLLTLRNYNNNDDLTVGGVVDVRFYCTTKRIVKEGKRYKNKERDPPVYYKPNELTSPGGRFANCFDVNPPALMITFTIDASHHSEIQICPWFLFNARGYKFKDMSSLPSSIYYAISKIAIPIEAKRKYTPIDSFILTDKTIVHELTHIDQWTPIPAEDVGEHPYGQYTFGFAPQTNSRVTAHRDTGLKNAKRIADDYIRNASNPDPHKNADSNSLFALGTWIIAKGGGPINEDGTFGAPRSTPKAKL
ncbi:hypothetical protein IQ06DRAFT_348414 [Phaeosphaeriaceae sp. SRC1lsM3a]|nr:hypothetical protein IQ06DRAFT_348414 [Stagonospora sp. SRC1lsM3a]